MKKEYSKPVIKTYELMPACIICTSEVNVKANSEGYPYEDSNNTNVDGMHDGSWNTTNDPD